MTHTYAYATIGPAAREVVKDNLVRVERMPSETDAYFIPTGHYKVLTSNGESKCEGPVWILWDKSGYPYPITPDEFEAIYRIKREGADAPREEFYQNVHGCARCGQDHDGLEFKPIVPKPIAIPNSTRAWTHFATCPNEKQPILIEFVKSPDAEEKAEQEKYRS